MLTVLRFIPYDEKMNYHILGKAYTTAWVYYQYILDPN